MKILHAFALTLLAATFAATASAQMVPVKHLIQVHGQMTNVVVGQGLVVGLPSTGSNDPVSRQHAINFLRRSAGVNYSEGDITAGNFALVTVTCELPPILHEGQRLDIRVNALSEASSLRGGELLPCELRFFDGSQSQTYVLAAGKVSVGAAISVQAAEASVSRNNTRSGSILAGGNAVRSLIGPLLSEANDLEVILRKPDPTLAVRVHEAMVRAVGEEVEGVDIVNSGLLRVRLPKKLENRESALRLLARLGDEKVQVVKPQKIIIDVDSGTIVAGGDIPISPGVVAVSSITISVVEEFVVSQPNPGINGGETAVVGRSRINVVNEGPPTERNGPPAVIRGEHTTVEDLLNNLKALQLTPLEIAVVFEELAKAGMIHVPVLQR